MSIEALSAAQSGNKNLTTLVSVFDLDPLDAAAAHRIMLDVVVGNGTSDLDGTGGDFELAIDIGGVRFDGATQVKTVTAGVTRARFQSEEIIVPAATRVQAFLLSPNAADVDVNVSVQAYEVTLADSIAAILLDTGTNGVLIRPDGLDGVLMLGEPLYGVLDTIFASASGLVSGAGSGTETLFGLDKTTARVVGTVDASGNRTAATYDFTV